MKVEFSFDFSSVFAGKRRGSYECLQVGDDGLERVTLSRRHPLELQMAERLYLGRNWRIPGSDNGLHGEGARFIRTKAANPQHRPIRPRRFPIRSTRRVIILPIWVML